jgi:hypothetical protein
MKAYSVSMSCPLYVQLRLEYKLERKHRKVDESKKLDNEDEEEYS